MGFGWWESGWVCDIWLGRRADKREKRGGNIWRGWYHLVKSFEH